MIGNLIYKETSSIPYTCKQFKIMNREIKIRNSKIKLVEIEFNKETGVPRTLGIDKNQLVVRRLFELTKNEYNNLSVPLNTVFGHPELIGSLWVIEKSEEKYGDVTYTKEEKDIILKVAISCFYKFRVNINLVDTLINAVGDERISTAYKEVFGKMSMDAFSKYVIEIFIKPIDSVYEETITTPQYTSGYGFNVYELISELVRDKAYICTSKDVVGDYSIMSRGKKDARELKTELLHDDWYRLVTVSRNSGRANLSLVYSGRINVEVPENTYGVEPGPRELNTLRSVCIIKDGSLWVKKLCVKVNSNKLANRIRHSRCNIGTVVFTNEFILDLTKIPLINNKLIGIKLKEMAQIEADLEFAKIDLKYYRLLDYKARTHCEKIPSKITLTEEKLSEEEKYLRSIGIYGNTYYPKLENDRVRSRYDANCMGVRFSGFPDTSNKMTTGIRQFINNGSTGHPCLVAYLKTLDTSGDLKKKILEADKKVEALTKVVYDYRFRLLMTRTLLFSKTKTLDYRADNSSTAIPVNKEKDLFINVHWGLMTDEITV